jgi:hypothetical protein
MMSRAGITSAHDAWGCMIICAAIRTRTSRAIFPCAFTT